MIILGIETSCDETAAAVVRDESGWTAAEVMNHNEFVLTKLYVSA